MVSTLPCDKLQGVLNINQAMKIRFTAMNWQEYAKRQQQCTVIYASALKFRNDEIKRGDEDMFIWHLKTDRLSLAVSTDPCSPFVLIFRASPTCEITSQNVS